jgi:hypothetical protein
MARKPDDEVDSASPREAAHLRHREKKRVTEMVVDGAGVKRIAPILHDKARSKRGEGKSK